MPDRTTWAILGLTAVLTVLMAGGGCRHHVASSPLRVVAAGDGPTIMLPAPTRVVVYAAEDAADTTIMLSDLPLETWRAGPVADGQIIHVELLWLPKPGATPMDASATNATIRHIIFAAGELGIYGGAGFIQPRGRPGAVTWDLEVRDSSLRLLESTDGFVDPFGPAELIGHVMATLDPTQTRRLHRIASQRVTDVLDRTRYVDAGGRTLARK